MEEKENFILTGGSGFIGSHFREKLQDRILLNIDLYHPGEDPYRNFVQCDILDEKKLLNLSLEFDPSETTLIHLAAVHFDFQKNYYPTNVDGTKNILKFIEKFNIKKVLFFSSVAVFGDAEIEKSEKSEKKPYNDYGKSKLMAEKLILDWKHSNPQASISIIRPAVVYGPNNFGNVFNLITQIKSGYYAIIGDGSNIKSIAYVKNIVDSALYILQIIEPGKTIVYNYSDYPQLSTKELSLSILKILNRKFIIHFPYWLAYYLIYPVDIISKFLKINFKINTLRLTKFTKSTNFSSNKIRKLGFKPTYSTDQALKNTISWIENNDIKKLISEWKIKMEKL